MSSPVARTSKLPVAAAAIIEIPTPPISDRSELHETPPPALSSSPAACSTNSETYSCVPQILETVEQIRVGRAGEFRSTGKPLSFALSVEEYDELLARVALQSARFQAFWHKLRLCYDGSSELLTIRMPLPVHEVLIAQITQEILRQLQNFTAEEPTVSEFSRSIISNGSSNITLFADNDEEPTCEKTPDGAFCHIDAPFPGVVLEVAHSQSLKEVDRFAYNYLLGTAGNIELVIGINIPYKKPPPIRPLRRSARNGTGQVESPSNGGAAALDFSQGSQGGASVHSEASRQTRQEERRGKTATLSLWRQHWNAQDQTLEVQLTCYDKPFRDVNGNSIYDTDLRIPLNLFSPLLFPSTVDPTTHEIILSAALLTQFVDTAERAGVPTETKRGPFKTLPAGAKIKKRRATPEEELDDEREAKIQRQEDRAAKRVAREDRAYR